MDIFVVEISREICSVDKVWCFQDVQFFDCIRQNVSYGPVSYTGFKKGDN